MSLITTIPFLSLFLTWWLLPESPRWLIARQKFQQAEDVLFKMARFSIFLIFLMEYLLET